jgi:hypothetical protein
VNYVSSDRFQVYRGGKRSSSTLLSYSIFSYLDSKSSHAHVQAPAPLLIALHNFRYASITKPAVYLSQSLVSSRSNATTSRKIRACSSVGLLWTGSNDVESCRSRSRKSAQGVVVVGSGQGDARLSCQKRRAYLNDVLRGSRESFSRFFASAEMNFRRD